MKINKYSTVPMCLCCFGVVAAAPPHTILISYTLWGKMISEGAFVFLFMNLHFPDVRTGGPPLTQKPLTRFPLPRLLAYVLASGGFSG